MATENHGVPVRIRVPPLEKILQNARKRKSSGYVAGAHLLQPDVGKPAQFTTARWLNPCGMFPTSRLARASYSSLRSAQDQTVLGEFLAYRLDGTHHAFVVVRQKPNARDEQCGEAGRRVEPGKHSQSTEPSTPTRAAVCRSASILHFGRDGDRRLSISLDHLGLPYLPRSLSKFPERRRERPGCSPG